MSETIGEADWRWNLVRVAASIATTDPTNGHMKRIAQLLFAAFGDEAKTAGEIRTEGYMEMPTAKEPTI